jgi:hypothetical protein
VQGHALVASQLGRDAVHLGRLRRDLTARVDESRPAPDHETPHHVHQCVRDRHIGEAVDARGLEIEPEHLTVGPCTHASSMPAWCDRTADTAYRRPHSDGARRLSTIRALRNFGCCSSTGPMHCTTSVTACTNSGSFEATRPLTARRDTWSTWLPVGKNGPRRQELLSRTSRAPSDRAGTAAVLRRRLRAFRPCRMVPARGKG